MVEDKEIAAINEKKLKAKGAKIVEEQKAVNYENIAMQLSQFLNDRGLEMMNVSTDIRNIIANERQRANSKKNINDSDKQ